MLCLRSRGAVGLRLVWLKSPRWPGGWGYRRVCTPTVMIWQRPVSRSNVSRSVSVSSARPYICRWRMMPLATDLDRVNVIRQQGDAVARPHLYRARMLERAHPGLAAIVRAQVDIVDFHAADAGHAGPRGVVVRRNALAGTQDVQVERVGLVRVLGDRGSAPAVRRAPAAGNRLRPTVRYARPGLPPGSGHRPGWRRVTPPLSTMFLMDSMVSPTAAWRCCAMDMMRSILAIVVFDG